MKYFAQQGLAGKYGDVFWNLSPSMVYVAGSEMPCTVYVANPTDTDREYMLSLRITREGETLIEYPVRVDNLTWFPIEADTCITLPGAMILGYTDAALTLDLYEKEQNEVVDTVSTALTSAGTAGLPGLPGLPALPGLPGDIPGAVSSLISMIILVIIIMMMAKMMEKL